LNSILLCGFVGDCACDTDILLRVCVCVKVLGTYTVIFLFKV